MDGFDKNPEMSKPKLKLLICQSYEVIQVIRSSVECDIK